MAPDRLVDPATGQPRDGAPLGAILSAQAALTPDQPAVTVGGRTLSFADLDAAANRRARALLAEGVEAGARVILAMPNRAEYLDAAFALWKIGAIPCPVSQRLPADELAAIVRLAGATHAIVDADLSATFAALDGPVRPHDVSAPLDPALSAAPLPPAIATPGKIATSGGSTGRPKLIVDPNPSTWGPDKGGCRRGPRLTLLNPGPLHHSAPFNTVTMALAQGTHVICMERFDAREWLRLAALHRADYAYLVPTMMARIARLPAIETATADLSSLRTVLHMAAPCAPDIKRWWIGRVGADHVWEVYGGTERIGVTTIGGRDWLAHPGSVGRPAPGQEIVIAGEDGAPLPPGDIGEIRFRRTDGTVAGYAYIGSNTRAADGSDGFGDVGWLDDTGYLYIADRRTDMILAGGVNIWPAAIEAAVEALPGVACCAAIGLPDRDLGNRVHLIVELAAGATTPDPAAFLRRAASAVPGVGRPRSVEFTRDPVRDEAGKVRRSALRAARIPA